MINYSIVMRSMNSNLVEINQAKSRINQAKEEGKTPDPKDLELVKTEKQNAFAISQYTDTMTLQKFCAHATHFAPVINHSRCIMCRVQVLHLPRTPRSCRFRGLH